MLGQVLQHDSNALKTPISVVGAKDSFWWPHSSNGCYSVKSGYFKIHHEVVPSLAGPSSSLVLPKEYWNGIWSSLVPQKVKSFIWKLSHNALPLKQNLCFKKLASCSLCPICSLEVETVEHSFLLCPWVTPIWFDLQIISVPTPNTISSYLNWLCRLVCPDDQSLKFDPTRLALIFIAYGTFGRVGIRLFLKVRARILWETFK